MNYVDTIYGKFAVHDNDLIGNRLSTDKIWEPYNIALMHEYIKKGDTVLDIGSNIGFFTSVLSDIVGDTGMVHSFEPVDDNHELLYVNTCQRENVKLYKLALGNADGLVSMASEHGNKGNSYITSEVDGTIQICKLDSLNLCPNFIKIDVQGFEFDVLLGAVNTISKHRPVMIVELEDMNNSIPTSFKQSKRNSLDLLHQLNYTVYNIESDYPADYLCIPNADKHVYE